MPAFRSRGLPKIDLHIHLEGSLPHDTLTRLAARHRLPVPPVRDFSGFQGFLRSFGAVCDLLVDEEDFEQAATDLFDQVGRIGVEHLEVLFSPQVFMRRGIPAGSIMRGLSRARARAVSGTRLSVVFIMDGVRQWGGDWFDEAVRMMAPWAGRGLAGVGVGGDETELPARAFAEGFRRARGMGLRTTIHAGEAAGPESIRDALDALRPDRIGHGIRAADDTSLMKELAEKRITLEVCPTSNIATGLVPSWRAHPLRRLFEAGVLVTINSDDGALFGTDTARELELAARELAFEPGNLLEMTRNAAAAAFVGERERRRLDRRIVEVWSSRLRLMGGASRRASARES